MRKLRVMATLPAMVLLTTSLQASPNSGPANALHDNGYGTPKIEYSPVTPEIGLRGQALAESYLRVNAARYGVPLDLSNLTFKKARKSLTGTHYHFTQNHAGIPVDQAQVIITLDPSESHVTMVFNNAFPFPIDTDAQPALNAESAFDTAWAELAPREGLLAEPRAKLKYVPQDKESRLVYDVLLTVAAPYGAWEYRVDAKTGEVISKRDRNIYRRPKTQVPVSGPVLDRRKAFSEWERRQATREIDETDDGVVADGHALVFDPDPRTTLKKLDLMDGSDAAAFEDAYVERPLRGLTKRGSEFVLEGPWVKIDDFDSPTSVPSKSSSGRWDFKRGQNAFNDVMTYFHIDQSQRYIQSLGFKDDTGIQYASIKVDSDGANGDDNSYFTPGDNTLAFGHGCVDDNEDADVILHEYGHALQWGINDEWDAGDTGAMGEGFGDYWAASYSLSTPNGADYYPAQVFSWDAHGQSSECWPGRVLDATHLQYDPNKSYPAHGTLGSNATDELWSTPLFQALLTAKNRGIPREEMDRIVLQSHFGLGSGLKMRELANATINAAKTLYPSGPHADIFHDAFAKQKIIDVPAPQFEIEGINVEGAGSDGVVDPGDEASLMIRIKNTGTEAAPSVVALAASTSQHVVLSGEKMDLGNVAIGAVSQVQLRLKVSKDLPCGEKIPLTFTVRFGNTEATLNWVLPTGRPLGLEVAAAPMLAIPDNDPAGVSTEMTETGTGEVTGGLNVDVVITHPYPRDLKIKLVSPSGTSVLLANRDQESADNLIGNFPATLTPAEPLSAFIGEPFAGSWRLTLEDTAARDEGTLESWALHDVAGYECQP